MNNVSFYYLRASDDGELKETTVARDADTTDVRTPVHTRQVSPASSRQESDQHRSNSGSNGHSDPQPRTRTKFEYLSGLSRGRTGRASRARDALGRGLLGRSALRLGGRLLGRAAFLAGAAFLAAAGDAFLDDAFLAGAFLAARVGAGAASSALVVGLRSRLVYRSSSSCPRRATRRSATPARRCRAPGYRRSPPRRARSGNPFS